VYIQFEVTGSNAVFPKTKGSVQRSWEGRDDVDNV